MKKFSLLLCIFAALCLSSCQTKPNQYNTISGSFYNNIDMPITKAWLLCNKKFKDNKTLLQNDSVSKTFLVQYHNSKVSVQLTALTPQTTQYTVKSGKLWKGRHASARVVYNEIYHLLEGANK